MRTRLQVNLGNALAYASRYRKSPFLSPIQVDKSSLLESLEIQTNALENLRDRPSDYFNALINIAQTYIDLATDSKYADRTDYLRAASECVEAMKRIPQTSLGIDHHLLGIVTESRLVLTGDSNDHDLQKVRNMIQGALSLISRASLDEKAMAPTRSGARFVTDLETGRVRIGIYLKDNVICMTSNFLVDFNRQVLSQWSYESIPMI